MLRYPNDRLNHLMIDRVKKMETLEQKDLPALEKSLKDYHVACMGTVPLLPIERQER